MNGRSDSWNSLTFLDRNDKRVRLFNLSDTGVRLAIQIGEHDGGKRFKIIPQRKFYTQDEIGLLLKNIDTLKTSAHALQLQVKRGRR